jgi:hypothetical protein
MEQDEWRAVSRPLSDIDGHLASEIQPFTHIRYPLSTFTSQYVVQPHAGASRITLAAEHLRIVVRDGPDRAHGIYYWHCPGWRYRDHVRSYDLGSSRSCATADPRVVKNTFEKWPAIPVERSDLPMRIWDVPPECLCRQHLLGEHRELHAIWTILTTGKTGYTRHPETIRWQGKLRALWLRHEALVAEMARRGYRHASPLDESLATGEAIQTDYVDPIPAQFTLLREKVCDCRLDAIQ